MSRSSGSRPPEDMGEWLGSFANMILRTMEDLRPATQPQPHSWHTSGSGSGGRRDSHRQGSRPTATAAGREPSWQQRQPERQAAYDSSGVRAAEAPGATEQAAASHAARRVPATAGEARGGSVAAAEANVAWLNAPENYLEVVRAPGSLSDRVVRLNYVYWLNISTVLPSVPPGSYSARCRMRVLPGFLVDQLAITAQPAPGCGEAASQAYTPRELRQLADSSPALGGWFEIVAEPVAVSGVGGSVELKVHATSGAMKKCLEFDRLLLEPLPAEPAGAEQQSRQQPRQQPAVAAQEQELPPPQRLVGQPGGLAPALAVPNWESAAPLAGAAGDSAADADAEQPTPCVVCLDSPARVGFLHGDTVHRCVCRQCAAALREQFGSRQLRCPMCRSPASAIVFVF